MDARLEDLVTEVERLKKLLDEGEDGLEEKLEDLQCELSTLKDENSELKMYFEEALQEAERLKEENEQLRVAHQEALLAAQLQHASTDEERLQTVLLHEKEVLETKFNDVSCQLEELKQQLKAAEDENDTLTVETQRLRKVAQDSNRELEKAGHTIRRLEESVAKFELLKVENRRLRAFEEAAKDAERLRRENESLRKAQATVVRSPSTTQSKKRSSVGKSGSDASLVSPERLKNTRKEWQELRNSLVDAPGLPDNFREKLDKAFKDMETLDAAFRDATQERDQVLEEIQELNNTVFSKSFKAPSAWAEREVKYKMEKKQWEDDVKALRQKIASLKKENQAYRDSNKTEEFEAKIQELHQKLKAVEAERNGAQHEVHELKLMLKPVSGEFLGDKNAPTVVDAPAASTAGVPPASWAKDRLRKSLTSANGDDKTPEPLPDTSSISRVANTVQHFNGQGVGQHALRKLLTYYAATAEQPLPSIVARSQDPPPEVLTSPTFKDVLQWMQSQGIGPEEVAVYLERRKEMDQMQASPVHSRNNTAGLAPVNTGTSTEEVMASPKYKEIQKFMEKEGIAPAAAQQYLAAFALSKGYSDSGIALLMSDDKLPEVVSSPTYAMVFQYLEDNAVAPGDITSFFERQRRKPHVGGKQNGVVDASWRQDGRNVLGLHNFGDVVSYFLRLGVSMDDVHKILGIYCKGAMNKAAVVELPEEMRSPPFKRVMEYLQAYSVHPDLAGKYLTRSAGVLNGQQADRFSVLIHSCSSEGLQPAQVIHSLQAYAGDNAAATSALFRQAVEVFHAAGIGPEDMGKYLEDKSSCDSPRFSYVLDAFNQRGMQPNEIQDMMEQYRQQDPSSLSLPDPHAYAYVHGLLHNEGVSAEEVRLYLQNIESTQASTKMSMEDILRAESWQSPSRPSTRSSTEELFASRPSTSEYTSNSQSPGQSTPMAGQLAVNGSDPSSRGFGGKDDEGGAVAVTVSASSAHPHSIIMSWTVEELDELKHDSHALQALIEKAKELAPTERTTLHYLSQAVNLERQVSVLSSQISKMQQQLSRADDYSFRIEDEVDRALAAAHKGDATALKVLRDRLRTFREDFDMQSIADSESVHQEGDAGGSLGVGGSLPIVEMVKMQQVQDKIERLRCRLRLTSQEREEGLDRSFSVDDFLQGVVEVETEVYKLRDENELLMHQLVGKKIELAETQEEFVKTRRALVRALEKQTHLSRKIDDLRAEVPPESESNSSAISAKRRVTQLKTGRSHASSVTPTQYLSEASDLDQQASLPAQLESVQSQSAD